MNNNEIREVVARDILASGGEVTLASSSYRMLYKLAKVKGIEMNGKASRIAALCGVKKTFVKRKAKQVMTQYVKTGQLAIPREFQLKGCISG